jgi:hypothetical protein
MIAKRITSKAAKPRIARLVKYVVAAQGGIDPRSWSRTADYMLASGTSSRGEKVGGVRVTNCNTDDPAAATTLIEATQAANTRSKTDKTYHLVFSFPPGEEPDLKVLHAIEDQLVAAIGYAEHQRISAVHIDTDHLHVHVAINKVHPKGFQNIEPYYDKKKLMETCERLELEYGLQRTNHGLTGQRNKQERETMKKPKLSAEVAQAEAHSGIKSLITYTHPEIANAMREAKTWNELHVILAVHGLQIKKRGAGLVIGSGDIWAKASQIDRAFSLKGLTDRLGPFEQKTEKVNKPYESKPLQSHPSSAQLFEQFQREKLNNRMTRDHGLALLKYESELHDYQLNKWRVAERLLVKVSTKGPKRRAALKAIKAQTSILRIQNRIATDKKYRQLIIDTATPSWSDWLKRQSKWGNPEALDVLRSRNEREPMQGDYLTAPEAGSTIIPKNRHLNHQVDQNGAVTYTASDGGVVIDRTHHVQCFKTTAGSSQLALDIAARRFSGQALIVEGQEQFKKDIATFAGLYRVDVSFADPEMEKIRKAAIPKEKITNKSKDKGIEL